VNSDSNPPLPIAVLISGTGRSLKNLLEQIDAGRLRVSIKLVISSTPSAKGLQFAEKANIPIAVLERNAFADRVTYSAAIFDDCRRSGVELVVLAGFIKRLVIPADFQNRVTNIHPALVPSFCGKGFYGHHVHEAVLEYGAKISGCTVHFVDNEYDHGPVILQKCVPVYAEDTLDSLEARVFEAECEAYPEALALVADGRITVRGRRVHIAPA
jgi:phosphoribosylglycinamide formyltransferase-1